MKAEYLGNQEFKVTNGNLELHTSVDAFGKKVEAKEVDSENNVVTICNAYDSKFDGMLTFLHNYKIENNYK